MDPKNAEDLRVHVAKSVFSETLTPEETKDIETSNILSQLASITKQIKGK